jgi:hypothetical protein
MKKIIALFLGLVMVGCNGVDTGSISPTSPPITEKTPVAQAPEGAVQATPTEAETGKKEETTAEIVEETVVAPTEELDHAVLLDGVLFSRFRGPYKGPEALAKIKESGDTRFVAGLIDSLRYQRDLHFEIGETLNSLTSQNLEPDWHTWVEWAGKHPEIEGFDGYAGWKGNLYSQIDPNFLRFVYDGVKVAPGSRVEEIVWGGVRVDGIPALDNPIMIDPGEADYLIPEERVFGVSINGDKRAYPARFLDWHEMFNDIVGGEPVSLAY